MTAAERSPIWLNPPKFWSATKDMSKEEVDQLIEYLMLLAEQRDLRPSRRQRPCKEEALSQVENSSGCGATTAA